MTHRRNGDTVPSDSITCKSKRDLYPRDGTVDDALYLVTDHTGSSEIAAFVRTEDSLTVVTPTRVIPRAVEAELNYQPLDATIAARRRLRAAYIRGVSPLQNALCDIRRDVARFLTNDVRRVAGR